MALSLFGNRFGNLALALLLTAAGMAPVAAAPVEVAFVQSARFTDVGYDDTPTDRQRDALLAQLGQYLERQAARYVPDGGKLAISITDVDMAGGFEPWRRPGLAGARIVKDLYPPRITLDFKLTRAGGNIIGESRRQLTDPLFMTYAGGVRDDPLRHEKKLLDDWLEREFSRRGAN